MCCAHISPFRRASDGSANDQAAARNGGSARVLPEVLRYVT
jgi:hypothetical protein